MDFSTNDTGNGTIIPRLRASNCARQKTFLDITVLESGEKQSENINTFSVFAMTVILSQLSLPSEYEGLQYAKIGGVDK